MIKKNGSFTVEAALTAPLMLFVTVLAINAGIDLRQDVIDQSLILINQKRTDIIQCMYHMECMENLVGEIYGD